MSDTASSTVKSGSIVAKAGLWYTVCNFLFRGMAFITTPIFARIMTKAEIGAFSNMSSWINILIVVTSFDLSQSIIRSKLEHKDDMDSYIWSILSLGSIATVAAYTVVCIFPAFFTNLFQMDMKYIHLMFLYLLVAPAYQMLITKHRAFYKYKSFVLMTGIMLVSATLLSLLLVLLMDNKLTGRVIGYYLPYIAISGGIYLLLVYRGKRIKLAYWKYACVICLPLVPHVLSMHLLNSSDKILLTRFLGQEYNAIYTIAYSCYHIVTILFDSLNKAWAPWLLESLHQSRYAEIKKVSKVYVGVFLLFVIAVLLFIPELIYILGGEQYSSAVYCLPPLIVGCMFQIVYTMYVNVEFYMKKTIGVAGATIIATLLNLGLDMYLLPRFSQYGCEIAALTTMAGFIVLFILHYFLVKRLGMAHVFDIKMILGALLTVMLIAPLMYVLYNMLFLRYCIALLYITALAILMYKYKGTLLGLFRKKRKPAV